MKEDKTRKEYYTNVIKEWSEEKGTDSLDDITINEAWKGSALHKMRNEKGKIVEGFNFPFSPFEY